MPILIGEKPGPDFRDPLGLLTDCHRRIEKFLDVLGVVSHRAQGRELEAEHRQALDVSLRYFRESAPRHAADEEESLFPRLLSKKRPESGRIRSIIELLNREHRSLDDSHKEIDELGCRWLSAGRLAAPEVRRFMALVGEVRGVYRRHIAQEESELFPLAVSVLNAEDLPAIADEMARRRGLVIGKTRTYKL